MSGERTKFIKSASTSTPVVNSKNELERIITRYGCQSFSVQQDYQSNVTTVTFVVPDTLEKDAAHIPVQLEVSARAVYDAMFGQPVKRLWKDGGPVEEFNPNGYDQKKIEQAQRVAWRQVILWVDAALSAAAAGVQPISQAFFAQRLIQRPDGTMTRIVDHIQELTGGNVGGFALLGSGSP